MCKYRITCKTYYKMFWSKNIRDKNLFSTYRLRVCLRRKENILVDRIFDEMLMTKLKTEKNIRYDKKTKYLLIRNMVV